MTTKHTCWHCTNALIHRGLVTFGNKRFIRYDCGSCQIEFAIEKKDASLVLADAQHAEIDDTADVKPIIAIYAQTPETCALIATTVREAGGHALEHTFTFGMPVTRDEAVAFVLSQHNIFRAHAVVLEAGGFMYEALKAFAHSQSKPVFDWTWVADLREFIEAMPPPGANLWHEQMLLDLAGIPAT